MTLPCAVCVIGVGELGTRIAGELSLFGIKVNVYDKDVKKVKDANYEISLQREELIRNNLTMATDVCGEVTTYTDIAEALQDVDFVFEAVVDNLEIKQSLYEEITHHCKSDTVVCSNTLQLNVEEIADNSLFQNRIIGCRYMMPVYRIPMVEVMYTSKTSSDIIQKVKDFFQKIGKRILVRKFDENAKFLTLSETKHFWKVAKVAVEERRSKMNEKRVPSSHGACIDISKTFEDETCGKEEATIVDSEEVIPSITESTIHDDDDNIQFEGTSSFNQDGGDEGDGDDIPNECVLCNDARINCVLVPCGHMWLCYECGKAVQKSGKGCPACRKAIGQIVRVFLP